MAAPFFPVALAEDRVMSESDQLKIRTLPEEPRAV
jgi:hypothetical protein